MKNRGSEFSKIKIRFYDSAHRVVNAACNIKKHDIVVRVPFDNMISMDFVKTQNTLY